MTINRRTLLAVLASTALLAGCGTDEPEPPRESLGAGLGKSYKEMLDQTQLDVDAANQRMQETEQRLRDNR